MGEDGEAAQPHANAPNSEEVEQNEISSRNGLSNGSAITNRSSTFAYVHPPAIGARAAAEPGSRRRKVPQAMAAARSMHSLRPSSGRSGFKIGIA